MKIHLFISSLLFAFLVSLISGCSTKGIYYLPNARLYQDPKDVGLSYDLVRFPSKNGKRLYALYFRTERKAKGTVIHLHGNHGNVSNHFQQSVFLLKHGFNVFVLDYQGFGGSEGRPRPQRTIEDAIAAVHYVNSVTSGTLPIGIFGQSIGAAVGTVAAAREPLVAAAALEAGFTSYRGILKDVMKRSWLLKPFAYFIPWMIAQRGLDPVDYIAKISPRPLLIIHGDQDRIIPFRMGQELNKKALEPVTFLIAPNADHLQCKVKLGETYEKKIADFFGEAFAKVQK